MRIYFFVLSFLCLKDALSQESVIASVPASQRVVNKFSDFLSVSNSERTALIKAVRSLEEKGIYSKLISLNIGKFFLNNKCYNLLAPLDYDGAFSLTINAGSPIATSKGIELHAGDELNTHFINDLAINAPDIGVFWYTNKGVDKPVIYSSSPFNIVTRDFDGRVYVNIWANSDGIPVPDSSSQFNLAERMGQNVQFYLDSVKYEMTEEINSANPIGNELLIQNKGNDFTLKIFGITEALNEQEVDDLKKILDELVGDLDL